MLVVKTVEIKSAWRTIKFRDWDGKIKYITVPQYRLNTLNPTTNAK